VKRGKWPKRPIFRRGNIQLAAQRANLDVPETFQNAVRWIVYGTSSGRSPMSPNRPVLATSVLLSLQAPNSRQSGPRRARFNRRTQFPNFYWDFAGPEKRAGKMRSTRFLMPIKAASILNAKVRSFYVRHLTP
jgi:hypothetical protein